MIHLSHKIKSGQTIHIMVLGKEEQADFPAAADPVRYYKRLVSATTGIQEEQVYLLDQVHGDEVLDADSYTGTVKEADGLYSYSTGKVLVVKTADCVPVFVWSNDRPFFAVIHSGWKGMQNGIVEKFLQANVRPGEKIEMYIGPCISKNEYEIGEDVAVYFGGSGALTPLSGGKYLFGQPEYLIHQLQHFELNIENSGICVRKSPDFFSHRRGDKGRNLNLIWLANG